MWKVKKSRSLLILSVAVLVTLVGILVMFGWWMRYTTWIQILPYFAPMQFNTALCFSLLGLAIIFMLFQYNRISLLASILVALMGILTLFEYILGINLGIDELFISHYLTVETSHPGRMAPNTALCFLLSGLILTLVYLAPRYKVILLASKISTFALLILSMIALFGYLFGIENTYGWQSYTRMAVHTAASFFVISIALWFLLGLYESLYEFKANFVPYWVFLIGLILVIGAWSYILRSENHRVNIAASESATALVSILKLNIKAKIEALDRVVYRLEYGKLANEKRWRIDAKSYLQDYKALTGLVWVNARHEVQWVESKNNRLKRQQIEKIIRQYSQNRNVVLNKNYIGHHEGKIFYIVLPVKKHNKTAGFLVAVLNVRSYFKEVIPAHIMKNYNIIVLENKRVIFRDVEKNTILKKNIPLHALTGFGAANWAIKLAPKSKMRAIYLTLLPTLTLLMGLLLVILMSFLAYHFVAMRKLTFWNQLILNSAGEGIYGLNMQGKVIFANPAAEKMLGYEKGQLLNCSQNEFLIAGGSGYKNYITGEKHYCDTEKFYRKDGTSFPVDYISTPINFKKGELMGAVVTFRDISLRKKAEKEALEREKKLEYSNKELESFSYSVSHDLRAPLRHIRGFSEIILQDKGNTFTEESQSHFKVVLESAKRMGELIDDLLEFSRAGRYVLKRQTISLEKTVSTVITEMSDLTKGRDIEFIYEKLPDLYADKTMLHFVMSNLIGNALKFTKNKEKVIIKIFSQEDESYHTISVADNGVGFDAQYAEKMFGVFQRLHKSSEFQGTGIGLANVARVIQKHGGAVSATGEIDKGATISFSLPKQKGEEYG